MAGRKGIPPKALVQAQTPAAADSAQQRAYDVLSGAIRDLQSRRHLEQFTSTEVGYVPASGGSATYFLAADGTWKSIVGSGAVDSVTAGSTMVTASPTTGAVVINVVPANFAGIPEAGVSGLVADLAARPTGSGAVNTLPKWTAASVLGNSLLTDDATTLAYNTNKFTVAAASGNTLVAGTLNVTGAGTFSSTLDVTGNFNVDTNKFSVVAASGNTTVAGTLTISPMTSGSVLFAGASGVVSQNNANFFWDDTNKKLGIGVGSTFSDNTGFSGTTVPYFEMSKDAVINTAMVSAFGAGASTVFPQFYFLRGRGTRAAPAAVQSGDLLGVFGGAGFGDGTVNRFGGSGNIQFTADGNWTTSSHPGAILFTTVPSSSTNSLQRLRIGQDGVTIVGAATGIVSSGSLTGPLQVTVNGGTAQIVCTSAAGVAQLHMHRVGGTLASPSAIVSGNVVGQLCYTGGTAATTATVGAIILGTATENWAAGTNTGIKLDVQTTATGGASRTTKLTIENDGGISLLNSSAAAVSAASAVTLRANTQLQVSENTGAYVTVAKGTGTANRITKWSNTTGLLADSSVSDDGTTFAVNTSKFTVTEASGNTLVAGTLDVTGNFNVNTNKFSVVAASGNTSVAGTLGVTGLSTLTGGFTLGADSSANTHKITSLTNGSSAQDAAAFGQLATAVNAAVSGTANTLAKFTGTNVVGNSSVTDNGTTIQATVTANTGGFELTPTGTATGSIANLWLDGVRTDAATKFTALQIKPVMGAGFVSGVRIDTFDSGGSALTNNILTVAATTLAMTIPNNLQVNGDVALGDAAGDKLTFHGGTGATQQTITGSRGGNAALADLLTKLATLGLIVDSTT